MNKTSNGGRKEDKSTEPTEQQIGEGSLPSSSVGGTNQPNTSTRNEYPALLRMPSGRRRGAGQWSEKTHNIGQGCEHDCRYCYARANAARFHRIVSPEEWRREQLKDPQPRIPRCAGRVMFPSMHDITPFYLPTALATLRGLLEKGNTVLIVSKPHSECISRICRDLEMFRDRIVFRFTIGTLNERLAKFWEPGAPAPADRRRCLEHALGRGFQTSVSMEPMLAGTEDAVGTFHDLAPLVTEKIWVGKMNDVAGRVAQTTPEVVEECEHIQKLQSDEAIMDLVRRLAGHPKVEWKGSIQDVIDAWSSGANSSSKANSNI